MLQPQSRCRSVDEMTVELGSDVTLLRLCFTPPEANRRLRIDAYYYYSVLRTPLPPCVLHQRLPLTAGETLRSQLLHTSSDETRMTSDVGTMGLGS
jgi:hypothetical protein